MADSFPRQTARTRRFTLGAPRTFAVAASGSRVVFLRSAGGEDPLTALWVMDLPSGEERVVADPRQLQQASSFPAGGQETAEEKARRERARETAAGIVTYAVDREARRACFSVAGRLWLADLDGGGCQELPAGGPVFDPRLNPGGDAIAYCTGGSLRVMTLGSGAQPTDALLAGGDSEADVTWGQAEFIAAEEMGRSRGFWWSPEGDSLLVTRVDNGPVATWWISDPAHPGRAPIAHRYPAAGTDDAVVELHRVGLDGTSSPVRWDRGAFPYLVDVTWSASGPPLLLVESRDHHHSRVLQVDGESTEVIAGSDDDAWVERIPGLPAWLDDGRLVWAEISAGTHRLVVGGETVTPPGLQVRSVLGVDGRVVFSGSEDPLRTGVWSWSDDGLEQVVAGGVVAAVTGGGSVVGAVHRLDGPPQYFARHRHGERRLASLAAEPVITPVVKMLEVGECRLRVGVVLPRDHVAGSPLPVVMCPYGGPGAQRVVESRSAWLEPQWLADQGFGVIVADGRGTPGRGPEWEREVAGDFATAVLEDQVTALQAAADAVPDLDVGRGVGIRGWSFGGYLAALAVLRRPDVFAVAVAGAPVTDWLLYDTYYTERFLGHPRDYPEAYRRSSLLDDAPGLRRPLMLIHGLADDNVVVAHSLRLSQALTDAGRPHTVLPLSGITHMATREEVAEHLLELQVDFLGTHLGAGVRRSRAG